jgi:ElaB/YqjD/DUF883 family membrane-anchored ribosome-binding protein
LAVGNGFNLHLGRVHSHSAGRRHHPNSGAGDSAEAALNHHFTNQPQTSTINIIMKTHHTSHKTAQIEEVGEHLMEDAQALLTATAHVAEEKVIEARKRLTAAIEKGKEAWNNVQEKAIAGAKATDQVIRDNPYKSLGIALGVGVLIGFLLRRRD